MVAKQPHDGSVDVFALEGVDELFVTGPSEFVQARDLLAKRLRDEGERDAAKAVKELRRPTLVAWGLNRVARERPEGIAELADAGAAVRDAYARVLSGDGGDALRELSRRRRKIIIDLADDVAELVGESHREEAAQTLEAASLDEASCAALSAAHLTSALEPPSGFELSGMPATDVTEVAKPKGPDPRELRRAQEALDRAEEALTEATDRQAKSDERLEEARADAVRAQAAVLEAGHRREEAVKDLARIEEG